MTPDELAELRAAHRRAEARLAEQAALVEAAVAYGAECEAYDAAEQAWRDAPHGDEVTQRARDSSMDQLEQAHDELTEAAVAYYRARQAEQGGAPADGSGEGQGPLITGRWPLDPRNRTVEIGGEDDE